MGINSFSPANQVGAAAAKSYQTVGPVIMSTGLGKGLVNVETYATQVELYGYKAVSPTGAPTNNTGDVWVGLNTVMTDVTERLAPGARLVFTMLPGAKLDLQRTFGTGTTGDGVFIRYLQ